MFIVIANKLFLNVFQINASMFIVPKLNVFQINASMFIVPQLNVFQINACMFIVPNAKCIPNK